ncbi:hypothetical protein Peur_000955 [Populus x canadensis]
MTLKKGKNYLILFVLLSHEENPIPSFSISLHIHTINRDTKDFHFSNVNLLFFLNRDGEVGGVVAIQAI